MHARQHDLVKATRVILGCKGAVCKNFRADGANSIQDSGTERIAKFVHHRRPGHIQVFCNLVQIDDTRALTRQIVNRRTLAGGDITDNEEGKQ